MRKEFLALLALTALAGGLYLACSNSLLLGQHVDDASYIMLGQALSRGQGYTRLAYPDHAPETKYPPLLPALIAPCLKLSGGALWAAKLPAFLSLLLAIPVLWALLRRFLDGWTLWLTLAVVALHPLVVGYAGMAMSEAPSLLLTWLTLLLVVKWDSEAASLRPLQIALLGLLLGVGILLRVDMVIVALAACGWLAWRGKRTAAALALLLCVAVVAPWQIRVATLPGQGDDYLHEYAKSAQDPSSLPVRMLHGASAYLGDFLPQTAGLVWGQVVEGQLAARGLAAVGTVGKWLTSLLLLAGLVGWWRRWPGVINVLLVLKAGLLFAWHFRYARFLLPLLPFLVPALAAGVGLLAGRRDASRRKLAVVALACLLVGALGRDALLIARPPRLQYPDVVAGGRLIREHVPPGQVTLCSWSAKSFYLYAQQPVLEMSPSPEGALTAAEIVAQGHDQADYVLLVQTPPGLPLAQTEIKYSPLLQQVAQDATGNLILYRVKGRARS